MLKNYFLLYYNNKYLSIYLKNGYKKSYIYIYL